MTYQGNKNLSFFTTEQSDSEYEQSEQSEEEYEKCNHEYSVFSNGFRTCLACGMETREIRHVR